METTQRETMIRNYLHAYNTFDVDGMVADFTEALVFTNRSNGEITLRLEGLAAFKEQAKKATSFFSERTQTVQSFHHAENHTEVGILYHGILAADLPNGMKKGEALTLEGISVFTFSGNKIVELTDIS